MPIGNDKDKVWSGWLVDGLGSEDTQVQSGLIAAIESREIPKTTVRAGTHNMWWRPKSTYIDITFELDGRVNVTVHIQPFGKSLWVGRAADGSWLTDNYYKRMATQAFLSSVDRAILESLEAAAEDKAMVHVVQDRESPAKGAS